MLIISNGISNIDENVIANYPLLGLAQVLLKGINQTSEAIDDAVATYNTLILQNCQGIFASIERIIRPDQLLSLPLEGNLSFVDKVSGYRNVGLTNQCRPNTLTFISWSLRCLANCNGTNDTLATIQGDPFAFDLLIPSNHRQSKNIYTSLNTGYSPMQPNITMTDAIQTQLLPRQDTIDAPINFTTTTPYTEQESFTLTGSELALLTTSNYADISSTTVSFVTTSGQVQSTSTVTLTPNMGPPGPGGYKEFWDSKATGAGSMNVMICLSFVFFTFLLSNFLLLICVLIQLNS